MADDDCEDISDEFITVFREVPDGGTITLADGSDTYVNCAGDIVFDVVHTTTAPNLSYWYIITDDNDNILAFQNSTAGSTLDLSGAPAGECHVWGWNYRGLPDPVVGNHISTLADDDCEDISDEFITVFRETPDGGTITLTDGSTTYANCAGDIVFDVMHTTTAPNLSYWYVITDDNDNILAFQNSTAGSTLDLSVAPPGECHVWGWNYLGLPDPVVGDHISTLADDDCEDISDEFITVFREVPDGGMVTTLDGASFTADCVGEVMVEVMHTTTAPNLSYWYIITNDNDEILAYQNSADGNVLDLSAAPIGECRIWGWNYLGLPDPVIGAHISTLSDDFCEDVSDGFLRVLRQEADGGYISLDDGSTEYTGCEGEIDFDLTFNTTAFLNYWFVVVDEDDNVFNYFNSNNGGWIDVNNLPVGNFKIYGWSEKDQPLPEFGESVYNLISSCGELSDNYVSIYVQDCEVGGCEAVDGGTVQLAGGGDVYSNCAGQIVFDVEHTTTGTGLSYWYIITDDNDNILAYHNSADRSDLGLEWSTSGRMSRVGLELYGFG